MCGIEVAPGKERSTIIESELDVWGNITQGLDGKPVRMLDNPKIGLGIVVDEAVGSAKRTNQQTILGEAVPLHEEKGPKTAESMNDTRAQLLVFIQSHLLTIQARNDPAP